jgi:hypothetical protein
MINRTALAALVALFSFSPAAISSAQGNTRAAAWYGDYVYEHFAGETAGGSSINFTYRLHLGDDGCRIDIEGYQTDQHIVCTARMQGQSLLIAFRSYPDGRTVNAHGVRVYPVGGHLLTLVHSTRGMVTRWNEALRPEGRVPNISLRRQ